MSMTITYSWSGGSRPLTRFKVTDVIKTWADESGPQVLSALKDETPVYKAPAADPHPRIGGRMRQATRYERTVRGKSVIMQFNAYTPYTKFVVGGTAAHAIEPRAARYLHYYDEVNEHFRKRVWHPGNAANNYPQRVVDAMRSELSASLMEKIREALEAS